jgi:hypothetical protein
MRNFPDFGLRIMRFLRGGISVDVSGVAGNTMVRPAEVAGILVLPSSTVQLWLLEVRPSFRCKVKIVQVDRYSVKILVRFLFVVPSSVGNASE